MSAPERAAETRRWLRYGREDLAVAETLLKDTESASFAARHTCFLAQQAAEKAIKAVLVYLDVEIPRRHDLDALRNVLLQDWRTREDHPRLGSLSVWIAAGRYPGDWPEPTHQDAIDATRLAGAVIASVERDLAQHGLVDDTDDRR